MSALAWPGRIKQALGDRYRAEAYLILDYLRAPAPAGARPDAEFAALLTGKRVALVGPAPTVQGSGQGPRIDAHDVVVRLNHAVPIPPNLRPDVGTRTEVLYHNLSFTGPDKLPLSEFLPLLPASGMWICSPCPYIRWLPGTIGRIDAVVQALGGRLPFRTMPPRRYLRLYARLRGMPNAGVCAIRDLMGFALRGLYMTGFTFYAGGTEYYQGYRGRGMASQLHDQAAQRNLVARWVRRDPRLRVDDPMREILFGPPPQGGRDR
ncbi:MAG TPA: glycosyltransferase family 29 protein [Candidatus Methylomirabilis sp.]